MALAVAALAIGMAKSRPAPTAEEPRARSELLRGESASLAGGDRKIQQILFINREISVWFLFDFSPQASACRWGFFFYSNKHRKSLALKIPTPNLPYKQSQKNFQHWQAAELSGLYKCMKNARIHVCNG